MASILDPLNNNNSNEPNKPSIFNRVLRYISNYGMNINSMVYKNSLATSRNEYTTGPNNKNLFNSPGTGNNQYTAFAKALASKLSSKRINYFDKTYPNIRRILADYAKKDRIKEYVNIIASDSIIYEQSTRRFCKPAKLPAKFGNRVEEKLASVFEKLYTNLNFNDGIRAWHLFKQFLIEGYLAFEIVYDDRQRNVLQIIELDHATIAMDIDPWTGQIVWVQFPEDPINRKILPDAHVIYLSYQTATNEGEISYIENLVRPYNYVAILEDTKIIWSVTTATLYRQFLIPTDGLSRQQAEEEIQNLIATYDDVVEFDSTMGFLNINGQRSIPAYKDVWLPKGENGSPEISFIEPPQLNLQDDTLLSYFLNKLHMASMIPLSRLDKTSGGGNMYDSIAEVTRDERDYNKLLDRLRQAWKEIIVKPLWIQMVLEFPEYKDSIEFKAAIDIEFLTDNQFEKWKYYSTLQKQSEIIQTLMTNIRDSEDKPYLSPAFLIKRILELSDEDLKENERLKKIDGIGVAGEGGGDSGLDAGDEAGGDEEGGGDEESGITL